MKKINFWLLFVTTTVIWYTVVSFIRWEYDWVKHLGSISNMDRLWFFLAIVGKTAIDYVLWSFINRSSERSEEEQRTYHYDEEGNDITSKTKIN